jgi:D-lactate dehydrogenase (cytochrome)
MNRILDVHTADFQIDVQPGILYKDMNKALARHGLFFAPDPGANASIGGMVSNNAAGTRTPKYGATKDNVLRLEVVLPSGEIIRTGTRAVKTSSGYDLVHLFIGSEGTLGVVTETTLKLAPLPDKFSAVTVAFPSVEAATRSVSSIVGSGLTPAALEFLDLTSVRALNTAGGINLPERPTLLMEFHSATEVGLRDELALVRQLCEEESYLAFQAGLGRAARDWLWRARHQLYEVLVRNHPGRAFVIVDVAVPISNFPQLVATAGQALARRALMGTIVGHAGDGNLHALIAYLPDDEKSYVVAHAADVEIVNAALALDGTATGEHGIGIGKREFMAQEHGHSLNVMRAIKNALDPNGIMNPGKVLPVEA